ncbi:ornithine decarboxylase [Agromyces sp. CF514]|uniref:type III PLP-dependent enzyme n=1 Tax=Agromyces sp. CF514 TaxID=1881031 RepID=UPI0008EB9A79|nr:type III PLP-dependent enzyme [Agromyces sp. CF514]SFR72566.1 ornithine decarboxylase [Agromyces sp. CF514]
MTVTTTEHGRHADRRRAEVARRLTRAERRTARREAEAEAAAEAAGHAEAHELPPHRELVRRRLAEYARRIDLAALVEEHGTPLLLLEPDAITAQLLELRQQLPGAHIHVALKALPHRALIRAVDDFGAGFDVASRGELDLLEREGVDLTRCVHTHPVKSAAELTGAYLRGVRTFVVDDAGEVDKFSGLPSDARVLVRLSFPNADAASDLSAKFGVAPDAAPALVEHCLRAGREVAGFTFHVGSQTTSARPWQHAIGRTLRLMRDLEGRFGIAFDTLDIGGGFPVAYDEPVPGLGVIAHGIREALAAAPARYRVIVEPGRFVTAPAMTLATRVIGTSERADGRWAHLDDGVYGSYSNIPAEGVHALLFHASELTERPPSDEATERAVRRLRERAFEAVTLAGPTCDSVDVIARGAALPRLAAGDLLVSPMMGAYTWATATGFNGIDRTPIHVLGRDGQPAAH